MSTAVLMTGADGLAALLAAVGAVLFGLAAVRQHAAVQDTVSGDRPGTGVTLGSVWRLVRDPAWLVGTLQAVVAGGLHILALALAPITLVQPIGVLAVPVTVTATVLRNRRRPRRAQVVGSLLSVGGVVALTLLLLAPHSSAVVLPGWRSLTATVAVATAAGIAAIVTGRRRRGRLRCVTLASTAAALFGLNSILIRTVGHILATDSSTLHSAALVTALTGIAVALPVGLWAMQTAYVSGSPQVVLCCLTLVDPLAAVAGGRLLLHDGLLMTPFAVVAGAVSALVAVAGVVFLSAAESSDAAGRSVAEPAEPALVTVP